MMTSCGASDRLQRRSAAGRFAATAGVFLVMLALLAGTPFAQRKTCVDCHEDFKDRLNKSNVHSPVREGCETCHKRHGFKQELVLVKGMPALCLDCHQELAEETSGEDVHEALTLGGCSVCHDPHASNNAALMRDVEAGGSICLTCHAELEPESHGGGHAPFAKGECASCHEPHSSKNANLLTATEEDLCASCHEGAVAKHEIPALGDYSCSDCHDAHLSSTESPLSPRAHAPFAEGDCASCHDIAGGEVEIGDDFPPSDLCMDCHDDVAALVGGSESHFGASEVTGRGSSLCLDCHEPHRSEQRALLTKTEDNLCRTCHEDLPRAGSHEGSLHKPFVAGECTSCHNPHGGGGSEHFVREGNALCATCHEDLATPAGGSFTHEAMDGAECVDCHSGHASENDDILLRPVAETCAQCHDIDRHTVMHVPYQTASCRSCHANHSTEPALLKQSVENTCLSCHKDINKSLTAAFTHEAVKEDDCLSCHVAHGGEEQGLLSEPQKELCTGCHDLQDLVFAGDDGKSTPALHTAVKEGDCSGCHNPHGSQNEKLLNRDRQQLCYSCHTDERVAFSEGYTHRPVTDGRCDQCHAPHGSIYDDLRTSEEPGLCTQCHNFKEFDLKEAHAGSDLSATRCTSCHAPHVSSQDKLLNPIVHDPFAQGECDACHSGVEAGAGAEAYANSVDAEACLMCHDEKTEESGHHQVGLACVECHTPHSSRFDALLAGPRKLCVSCHDDILETGGDAAYVHRPIEDGTCMDCHELHDPAGESFLAKPQQELCSTCHESIATSLTYPTTHAPFAKGNCSTCHETHVATEANLLTMSENELCASCHELAGPAMSAAHKVVPLRGGSCTSCHNPHATEEAGSTLLHPVRHSPYEDGDCDSCHEPSGTVAASYSTCAGCHDNDQNYEMVHHGARSGDDAHGIGVCLDCHSPHVGHESLLKRDSESKTCISCHDRKEFSRTTLHGALEDGCSICHDVHTNNVETLRSAEGDNVCLDCHDEAKSHLHPIGVDYKDPRTGGPLICVSCHEPHSSDHEKMLAFDQKRALCIQCHAAGTMKVH